MSGRIDKWWPTLKFGPINLWSMPRGNGLSFEMIVPRVVFPPTMVCENEVSQKIRQLISER